MSAGSYYKAIPVAANSTVNISSSRIGGFIPTASGTWTFTFVIDGVSTTFSDIPVHASNVGLFHKFPAFVGTDARSSVTTTSNGEGILFTS